MIDNNTRNEGEKVPEQFGERLMFVLRTLGELAPENESEVILVEDEVEAEGDLPASLLNEVALSEEIISTERTKIVPFFPQPDVQVDQLAFAARFGKNTTPASIQEALRGEASKITSDGKSTTEVSNVLSPARKVEIVTLSESIFESHNRTIPVDPVDILLQEGLTYSFGNYGDSFDGLLGCKNRKFHIYCNRDRGNTESSPRARFTIAHELGHYFIDEHRWGLESGRIQPHGSMFGSVRSNHLMEREADLFAASLLVPSKELITKVPSHGAGLTTIVEAADIFDVSVQCAAIQMAETGLGPCALFFWNEKGYRWKWSSPSFYAAGYKRGIKDRSLIPPDSATGLALIEQDKNTRHQIYRNNTVASFWFPGIRQGSDHDVVLKEEALCLGSYGVLTAIFA